MREEIGMRVGLAVAATCGLLALAGCSGGTFNSSNQAVVTGGVAGARLAGSVMGGRQPIVGSHVYLFAANTTGYGGAGIATSSSNASLSLLTSGTGRTLDASGGATNGDYYVTTDASGNFSISGDYTCAQNQQVYLYALGGNPGSGTNSAAGLMAVLGNCPAAQNFASATPFVVMNEVSTVAAAYAMAGFATDATHVSSSGTALALTGITNAFANAANLVTLATGSALATTPAGNGTVPQAEINTLGNVLASCVNSTGPGSGTCGTLFANALSGGTTGTQATDTASVAINLAHNPAANLANLYALAAATPPFGPALTAQPNDLTLAIQFSGGGLSAPQGIAIDRYGNAWVPNAFFSLSTPRGLTEFSSLGAAVSPSTAYSGPLSNGSFDAIDPSGNIWVINAHSTGSLNTPGGLVEYSSSGSALQSFYPTAGASLGCISTPGPIAIDAAGSVWLVDQSAMCAAKVSNTGAVLWQDSISDSLVYGPRSTAIDGSGNAWIGTAVGGILNFSGSGSPMLSGLTGGFGVAVDAAGDVWGRQNAGLVKLSNSGSVLSGSGYIGGGFSYPNVIALDGAGNVWAPNQYGSSGADLVGWISEMSNLGQAMSGTTGFVGPSFNGQPGAVYAPLNLAIDGSGNVWVTNTNWSSSASNATVTEFIGAAVPVVTPIAAGLPTTPTADGSSKLGTRP
jgi:hypothetical protein